MGLGALLTGIALCWGAVLLWPSNVLDTPFAQLTLGILLRLAGSVVIGLFGISSFFRGVAMMDDAISRAKREKANSAATVTSPRPMAFEPRTRTAEEREKRYASLKWSNLPKSSRGIAIGYLVLIVALVIAAAAYKQFGV